MLDAKALSVLTLAPTNRVEVLSFELWELGILGLQELPPENDLFAPQLGTEFREPQSVNDWTKDEQLIESSTTRLKIFLPDSEEVFSEVKNFLDSEGLPLLESEEVIPEQYIEEYKKRVQGKDFGANLWIGPPWAEKEPSPTQFIIDPGMAFGTGEHPTTQMAVQWLCENNHQQFSRIVDIGAGSGILSIAARRCFPKAEITATDLDLNCEVEIPKNFQLNKLSTLGLRILCGEKANLSHLIDNNDRFDLIVSNIYGEVLASLSPQICELLEENGIWLATGVLDGNAKDVFEAALRKHELHIEQIESRRDEAPNDSHLWHCYVLQKI